MSTHLRSATVEDASAIAEVYLTSRHTFLSYAPLAHTDEEVRVWIRDVLIPAGGVHVATRDGVVIGMLGVCEREDASWIDHLYLHPDHVGWHWGAAPGVRAQAPVATHSFVHVSGESRRSPLL